LNGTPSFAANARSSASDTRGVPRREGTLDDADDAGAV
jgi:hypothetical protein